MTVKNQGATLVFSLKQTEILSDTLCMKIAQSSIMMLSSRQFREKYSRSEKLEAWVGSPPGGQAAPPGDRFTFARGLRGNPSTPCRARKMNGLDKTDEFTDPRILLLKMLIEYLTGHKLKLVYPKEMPQNSDAAENINSQNPESVNVPETVSAPQMEGWGIRYDSEEIRAESEQTSVAMQGAVKTADGKEIAFNLDLQMSRSYVEKTSVSIRLGDAKIVDPIVVNFGGGAAQLTDWKFDFDLNADGIKEQTPFVTGGSGILVFDKNGDRQVNDGTELFGPVTGNGFNELGALDEDKNGWIDENDSAYNKLDIWSRDDSGNESLLPLSQMNVGALFVRAVSSPFDLRDQTNNIEGQIISTGLYLSNSGLVGSLQQIDVAV